eukprot:794884-Ditylum_brightwellii.AAC.1
MSDRKTPYTSKQILTTAPHTIQRTGWFKDGIRAWKARDLVDKTWQNFKKDFAKEYDEIKKEQEVTAQAAGYTQANNAIEISKALDNLTNAAMSDRKTVEDLSKANKEMAETNKQLTTQMERINEKLASITKLIETIPTTSNNARGGRFTKQ